MCPFWTRTATRCLDPSRAPPSPDAEQGWLRVRHLRIRTRHPLLGATILLLAALLTAEHAGAAPDRVQMLASTASVVRVQAFDERGRTFIGTGVVVAPQRIATSCHVTRHGQQIVVIHRGETLRVAGQLDDIDHDVCVLDVPLLRSVALDYRRSTELRVGQPVWAMGFEGGAGIQFRVGILRGLHRHDGAHVIESTTAFTSGASGGALMTEDGRLVGLLTYRLRGDRRSYFSVPMDWLPAGLSAETLPDVAPITQGTAFWQRSGELLPYFLRAHRHVTEADWPALRGLTDRWLAQYPQDAEAWWFHGAALERAPDPAAAARAYRRALNIEPRFLPALMGLGRLSVRFGEPDESTRIISLLHEIGGELGACLDELTAGAETESRTHPALHENCNDF